MDERLDLSQQQRLQQRLSPQQVQFGRYLEMTAPEIEDEVRHQLDENPALEQTEHALPEANGQEGDFNESAEELQRADYRDEDDIPFATATANRSRSDFNPVTIAADDSESVFETLSRQLDDFDLSDIEREVALYIVGNLDGNGYLTRSLTAIADDFTIATGREATPDDVARANATVRSLEPAGIGAVDLRDCLSLQLARTPNTLSTRIAREIIADYFDLFSKKHFDKLRAALGVDEKELQKALDIIRALNPKPGALLEKVSSEDCLRHIIPDFSVEADAEGRITVTLLSRVPELSVEASFDIADSQPAPRHEREHDAYTFIRRKRDEAVAFIKLMSMRAQTLLSVMTAIARIQSKFFTTGDRAAIRPMVLRDVSEATGYDLSTISRATASKYVLTPSGIYPLKMFFNEAPTDDGDTSSHEIIETLRELIEAEDKKRPLSDQTLTEMLNARGYDIARRTVAKYREKLNLPVARLRKEQ